MTPVGIVLLIIGVVLFVGSFFLPDRGDRESKQDIARKKEQIRKLMESELDGMKLRVNEATNETVEFNMEKSERALEKIASEKIMAVSEYATTIMEEIDRNHKEVLFLYDMLNDKQTDVKNSVRHAEAAVREANDAAKVASDTAMYATNVANAASEAVSVSSAALSANTTTAPSHYEYDSMNLVSQGENNTSYANQTSPLEFDNSMIPTESVFGMAARMEDFSFAEPEVIIPPEPKEEPAKLEKELTEFEILEQNTKFNNVSNNNQMILKLNAEGVPVVDIARQLSLGVGEVQLVIDLFK